MEDEFVNENENQNIETPQVEVESAIKRHFSTVTLLSKILAMVLFVALPFLGFWVGVQYSLDTQEVVSNISLDNQPIYEDINFEAREDTAPHKTLEGDLAINYDLWSTYENDLYGFSFKYPEEYVIEVTGDSYETVYLFDTQQNKESSSWNKDTGELPHTKISVFHNPDSLSVDEWEQWNGGWIFYSKATDRGTFETAHSKGVFYNRDNSAYDSSQDFEENYVIEGPGYLLAISSSLNTNETYNDRILQSIVSTLVISNKTDSLWRDEDSAMYEHEIFKLDFDGEELILLGRAFPSNQIQLATSNACYDPEIEFDTIDAALKFKGKVLALGEVGIPKKYNDDWQNVVGLPEEAWSERPENIDIKPLYRVGNNLLAILDLKKLDTESVREGNENCNIPAWNTFIFRLSGDEGYFVPDQYDLYEEFDGGFDSFVHSIILTDKDRVYRSNCSVSGCG